MKTSIFTAATPRAAPGLMAQVLAIAMSSGRDSFETVLEFAAPIVDSIEFHTS